MRRRVELIAVVGLSMLGVAIGLDLARRTSSDTVVAGTGPAIWTMGPRAPLPKGAPAAGDRAGASVAGQELSFSRLMQILGAEAQDPAVAATAEKVVAEFKANPELRKTYQAFAQTVANGGHPPASAFLGALRDKPAFQKLARELGASAGGATAMMALARKPELQGFLNALDRSDRREARLANNPWRGARGPASRETTSAFYASEGSKRGLASAYGTKVFGATGPASGSSQSAGVQGPAGSGGERASAAAGAPAAGGAGARTPSAFSISAGGRGSAGEIDPKLGKIEEKDSEKMKKLLQRYPWLNHVGENYVWRLIKENRIDQFGLWGACFSMGIYGRCFAACEEGNRLEPGSCTPIEGWRSCMDWQASELGCIRECRRQSPACSIPDPMWQKYCVPVYGGQPSVQLNPPVPYPECATAPEDWADAPESGESEPCTPSSLSRWTQGIGLPGCVGESFCAENGQVLPRTLPELVNWGNQSGRRNPADGVWTCR